MDAQPQKKLLKLRTFAQDMEQARQKSGVVLPGENKESTLPKAAAPSAPTLVVESAPVKIEAQVPEKHIPAFHELQKKSSAPTTLKGPDNGLSEPSKSPVGSAPKRTVSVRAKKRDLKAVKNVGGGTIITDSKAEGFKLIPSIIKSIDDWIKGFRKAFKKKAAPQYVISDTERRRGVIQKATSKTGSIFTADNETLKEEIRRRQAATVASNDVDINWSPNTEAGYALLDSGAPKPITSNVSIVFKKQSSPAEPPVPVMQDMPIAPPAPVVSVPVIVPPPTIVEPSIIVPIEPEPAPETPEQIVEVLPVVEEEVLVDEVEDEQYELTTPEEHYKIRTLGDITRINTNILSIGIIGAIAGIIIFIVIVRALLIFIIPGESRVNVEPPMPLAETTLATDVAINSISSQAILEAIQSASSVGTATELRFVDEKGQPITKDVLLPLLGFDMLPNLNRTISDVRVVVRGPERGFIFTVTDSTTALGSLLSSENTLVNNLAGTLAINTADLSGGFTDTSFGAIDVRIFTTNSAEQRLVYGFIDINTVVITNGPAFFTTILGSQ